MHELYFLKILRIISREKFYKQIKKEEKSQFFILFTLTITKKLNMQ